MDFGCLADMVKNINISLVEDKRLEVGRRYIIT